MHTPRKRFGQHFLCDQAFIHQIVATIAPQKLDHLVEIGPGQGALTVPILREVKALEVVELDRDLVPELKRRTKNSKALTIYTADALTFDFDAIKKDDRMLRVFGNLPYNISTPLIFHLLKFTDIISDMIFMLQKEVARRLTAKINTHDYSRLTVMVQYHCQVELLFDVPNSAFYPMPQVQSSMVRFTPYRELPHQAQDYALFASLVKHAFGQRRKTLRNSLKELVDDQIWATLMIHSDQRPENLQVSDFVAISNAISELSHG